MNRSCIYLGIKQLTFIFIRIIVCTRVVLQISKTISAISKMKRHDTELQTGVTKKHHNIEYPFHIHHGFACRLVRAKQEDSWLWVVPSDLLNRTVNMLCLWMDRDRQIFYIVGTMIM